MGKYGDRTYKEGRQSDGSKVVSRSNGETSRHDKYEGLSKDSDKHGHKWVKSDHTSLVKATKAAARRETIGGTRL